MIWSDYYYYYWSDFYEAGVGETGEGQHGASYQAVNWPYYDPNRCPELGSQTIGTKNFGTETICTKKLGT